MYFQLLIRSYIGICRTGPKARGATLVDPVTLPQIQFSGGRTAGPPHEVFSMRKTNTLSQALL
jgi:hypothetical protein